jgi:hypothetical protein
LEPQRSNVATNSETFGAATGTTIVLNNTASPDGYVSADKLVEDTSTGVHITTMGGSLGGSVDSSVYCVSVFAKASGRTRINIFDNNQASAGTTNFDISNGVVISGTGKIENYGNGWYRCSIFPAKTNSTTSNVQIRLIDSGTNVSYTGNGTSGVFLWGKQIEAGAYATSYIPTLGTSVTRVADAASKTGISSLIGQAEGTLFLEFDFVSGVDANYGIIYQSAFSTYYYINQQTSGSIFGQIQPFGITFSIAKPNGRYKCALAYKSGNSAFFVNGVQVGTTNTTTFTPATMDIFSFSVGTETNTNNQALLFKTRLDNATLQSLTTL